MKVRQLIIMILTAFLLGLILMDGSQSLAFAQSKSETIVNKKNITELPSKKVDKPTNELLSEIKNISTSLKRYEKKLESASAEDRLVLQLQIYRLRMQIMDEIHKLADELLDLEKTGTKSQLRVQVEDQFTRITPQLWFHINRLRGEIDKIRVRRIKANQEERLSIENEIANLTGRLNAYYERSLSHITKMKQIGMEVERARENFIRHLYVRADELSGRLELALARIDELDARRKQTPDDTNVVKLLIAAKKSMDTNKKGMSVVLGLMEKLELDTGSYRTQLVAETRDIGSGLLDTGVAVDLLGRTLRNTKNWLVESGPGYLVKLLLFVAILFAFRFIARVVRTGLKKALDASNLNLSQLARRIIVSTSSNLVMLFGILVALSQLGISLGPLLAGLGIAGFIVGFALQDTLGNFAAGMMILLYRPYDIGDLIDVGGVFGQVDKMSLVSTSLLTFDNQLFVVPNSKIWGDVIKNVTAQDIRRVDMVFGISYSDDIPKAESILEDILQSHDKVLDEPEPMVRLHTLGESSVDFVVRPWVKVDDYWEVYWDVTRTVKLRFDAEGVSIPFPQRDVHVHNQKLLAGEA